MRRTAVHALSSLLSHGTPTSGSGRAGGLGVPTRQLVDAVDRAGQFQMDPETRCSYFECVSHLVGRAGDSLTAADMDRLMAPLVDAWNSQPWKPDVVETAAPRRPAGEQDRAMVPVLSVALGNVATYGKSLYVPFAERVFEKACTDIEGCVLCCLPSLYSVLIGISTLKNTIITLKATSQLPIWLHCPLPGPTSTR